MTVDELEVLLAFVGRDYNGVCILTSSMTAKQWSRLKSHAICSTYALAADLRNPRRARRAEPVRILAGVLSDDTPV